MPTIVRVDLKTIELKIARSENLPVLPQVVTAVLKLADDPNASPRAMERLVESDAAVTAKILRVANSPHYGGGRATSVARAISVLGMNAVRSLVLSVAYQQVVAGKQVSKRFDKLAFWRHSLATATAARIVGKIKTPMRAEELYGAAMMHDVGILVLDKFCPDQMDEAIRIAQKEGAPLHRVERNLIGFDHAEVGFILSERWGLSCMTRSAIRFHHDPFAEEEYATSTCVVAAANALAYEVGCPNHAPKEAISLEDEILDVVGIPREQCEAIRAVVSAEVAKAEQAFRIS